MRAAEGDVTELERTPVDTRNSVRATFARIEVNLFDMNAKIDKSLEWSIKAYELAKNRPSRQPSLPFPRWAGVVMALSAIASVAALLVSCLR